MAVIKFIFHLKSGKVFETVAEMNYDSFVEIVNTIKFSFKEGVSSVITLNTCIIRLSECAVVDWEVLSESKAETSTEAQE